MFILILNKYFILFPILNYLDTKDVSMRHIIFFGPPGCGKGTQGQILSEKFGFIHLSTGNIFRNHILNQTPLGKVVFDYINKGILVPDQITTNLLKLEIKKYIGSTGIIYDGYPRTKHQVISLEKILNYFSLGKINIIFHFEINTNCLIKRLLKRGKISNRYDDINIKTVKKRIEEYDNETSYIWNDKKWKKYIVKLNASYSINNISFFIEKEIINL
ncbi:adenylate kinase family protein [Blattabacterium cuenoti]|uniref:adenylate kinase family protein n=1 Tax=Blattabacterium cuenoti TaxID=1653831 RepID=UPI001EEB1B27|nr:nucleoside monophosphate kinase [Blattabacterium cuenoti]